MKSNLSIVEISKLRITNGRRPVRRLQLLLVDVLTAGGDQFSKLKARLGKTKIQLEKEKKDGEKFNIFYYIG